MNLYNSDIKNSILIIYLYVVSCAIAFVSKIGYTKPNTTIQYSVFIFWIIIALFKFSKNRFCITSINSTLRKLFLLFLIPRVFIHIYSIILYVIGATNYVTRNTQTYLVVFAVFAVIYIFGENIIWYTIAAALLSYGGVIIYDMWVYGIDTIPKTIISLINGQYFEIAALYEVNDYSFAIGYLIIFYFFIKEKFTKKDLIVSFLLIIFMFLGLKRIQLLAIILVCLYVLISKFVVNKFMFYKFTSYIYILVAYLYIWMMSNSMLFEILNKLGINTMGRSYYYQAIIKLCEFEPGFLGLGRNYVSMILNSEYAYLNVGGVHSDILKYFAECGFVLFGIWMWYYLIKVVRWLKENYSIKVVSCYYILTLYSFAIYYTDNIDTYFISQFIYILIITVVAINDKNDSVKN